MNGEAPSPEALDDVAPGRERRRCLWCGAAFDVHPNHVNQVYCKKGHRQAAWKFDRYQAEVARGAGSLRVAVADPVYPGCEGYYEGHPDYRGPIDHRALLAQLAEENDGWALSTSARALPMVMSLAELLRLDVAVGAWVRGQRARVARGAPSTWEPVVYHPARSLVGRHPGDALIHGARCRQADPQWVIGSKPGPWWPWVFGLIQAQPQDTFRDLFPGSGLGQRAWELYAGAPLTDRVAAAAARRG